MATVLAVNTTLQRLNLACNRVDIKCLRELVKGLKGNSTLQSLNVSMHGGSSQSGENQHLSLKCLTENYHIV